MLKAILLSVALSQNGAPKVPDAPTPDLRLEQQINQCDVADALAPEVSPFPSDLESGTMYNHTVRANALAPPISDPSVTWRSRRSELASAARGCALTRGKAVPSPDNMNRFSTP